MRKLFLILTSGVLLSGMVSMAVAETSLTPKAQFAAEIKKARVRYVADKKLCNDEATSNARVQCRRDANAEYAKALTVAKAQIKAPVTTPQAKAVCTDCGRVVAVTTTDKEGDGSAVGIIAGGAAGAVLGHQVGGGVGKDLATIAGAVGGAYAGKKIEGKVNTRKVWTVSVHHANGSQGSFDFDHDPGLTVGDQVKISGNTIVRN